MQVLLKRFSNALQSEIAGQIHTLRRYFDDAELDLLKARYGHQSFASNDRICNVGADADAIYCVLSGSVLCWEPRPDNKMLALDIMARGGFCGEVATIGKIKRTASITALTPTDVGDSAGERVGDLHRAASRPVPQDHAGQWWSAWSDRLRIFSTRGCATPSIAIRRRLRRWDRVLTWPPNALGSYWFLLVLAAGLYCWYVRYQGGGWDTNVQWLPLWLSILQIVIGTLVLKSQLHTQKMEEEPRRQEREANLIGGKVIEAFEEKQADTQPARGGGAGAPVAESGFRLDRASSECGAGDRVCGYGCSATAAKCRSCRAHGSRRRGGRETLTVRVAQIC